MSDQTPNLQALQEAYAAAERLAARGLAVNEDGRRGLNNDGLQTLGDLATLLMLQTQTGEARVDRVTAATCRAMVQCLAALVVDMRGGTEAEVSTAIGEVQAQLRAAMKEART